MDFNLKNTVVINCCKILQWVLIYHSNADLSCLACSFQEQSIEFVIFILLCLLSMFNAVVIIYFLAEYVVVEEVFST